MPLLSIRRSAWSAAFIGALGIASFQGGDATVVVIEYRGPSNEFIMPIVLAHSGRICADVQSIMVVRRRPLVPSQCPVGVTPGELAAIATSLKGLRSNTTGLLYLQPELLRATILEGDSQVTEVRIPKEEVQQALDAVERHAPPAKYPELRFRIAEMRRSATTSGVPRPEAVIESLPATFCGARAAGIDKATQSRIVHDLTQISPTWSVRTLSGSEGTAQSTLELVNTERRVFVSIAYQASSEDAARTLRCRLMIIPAPRFRRVAGFGDDAYVLAEAHMLFRTGTLVFHVMSSDMSFDAEQMIANRLIASLRSRE